MGWKRFVKGALAALVAVTVAAVCTSGDDSDITTGGGGASTETTVAATGPAPGVTDDSIKVGVTYVDTEALVAVGLNYDLGDHEAVYQALFDDINADGGINGRQIEPVFAPIDPTNPAAGRGEVRPADRGRRRLRRHRVLPRRRRDLPAEPHATAVVGGAMTPERLEGAEAPGSPGSPDPTSRQPSLQAFAEQGELDGTVGVCVADAGPGRARQPWSRSSTSSGSSRPPSASSCPGGRPGGRAGQQARSPRTFEAAGVDTVVLVGASAQDWPTIMADDASYRPKLLFLDIHGARAFYTNAATTDTSVLEGSVSGGGYGPDQARFDEPSHAGVHRRRWPTPAWRRRRPEESGDDPSNQPYQAAFQACPDVALLGAWLEAAGEDLNYGTLADAIDGLEVEHPGRPGARTYGPPPTPTATRPPTSTRGTRTPRTSSSRRAEPTVSEPAPTLHLPARDIPIPTSVSPEAQAVLAMPALPVPERPPVDDVDGWWT